MRAAVVLIFGILGLLLIYVQQQKDIADKRTSDTTKSELINWQRGDYAHPPHINFTTAQKSDTTDLVFLLVNDSQYPGYDVNVRLWDIDAVPKAPAGLQDILSHSLAIKDFASLAPKIATSLTAISIPMAVTHKRFAAQFSTRVGAFSQEIQLRRLENGHLAGISRQRTMDAAGTVVFERIDPAFPRNALGGIDW